MQKQALAELIEFLEEKAATVHRLEDEGEKALQSEGQQAFQVKLEKKAELLAALGEKAWPMTEKVGGELGDQIAQRLEQFSTSASTALRIGSVFFMTALLYPEDHKSGEPNDLENYITELKGNL
ncbi:hypothetical protein [Pseudodesulfovibrio sp. zrk46]|uniref:hypothetical protein n=1 Tax=Pseudodesulfovibrio sp. zrk46 TaxID=2725288 RepID=UPI0014499257|nr:hypothetical protein [Pseudodesulfovibrio sp. zrk46]QJB58023.1 hypothetical protein HFN16_17270 [Pseudodesulfovibrio sp. zrk46]